MAIDTKRNAPTRTGALPSPAGVHATNVASPPTEYAAVQSMSLPQKSASLAMGNMHAASAITMFAVKPLATGNIHAASASKGLDAKPLAMANTTLASDVVPVHRVQHSVLEGARASALEVGDGVHGTASVHTTGGAIHSTKTGVIQNNAPRIGTTSAPGPWVRAASETLMVSSSGVSASHDPLALVREQLRRARARNMCVTLGPSTLRALARGGASR